MSVLPGILILLVFLGAAALMFTRRLPALLRIPRAELRDRYPNFQTELMTGTGPGHDLNNTTA